MDDDGAAEGNLRTVTDQEWHAAHLALHGVLFDSDGRPVDTGDYVYDSEG